MYIAIYGYLQATKNCFTLVHFKQHNSEALSDTTFSKGHHNRTTFKKQKFE